MDQITSEDVGEAATQYANDILDLKEFDNSLLEGAALEDVLRKVARMSYLTGFEDAARLVEDDFDISDILD